MSTGLRVALLLTVAIGVFAYLTHQLAALGFFLLWPLLILRSLRGSDAFRVSKKYVLPDDVPRQPDSIDLGDELGDLLKSAWTRAARQIESKGAFEPFVMYEDAAGNVRVHQVATTDPDRRLGLAREAARSVDDTAPRLVLVAPDTAKFGGREKPVVRLEAAERRFQDRTLAFVMPIRPRFLFFPGGVRGYPIYMGDAGHTLRFSRLAQSRD